MERTTQEIHDLRPDQREAAEKLLGRSLASFQKIIYQVLESGNKIVVYFVGAPKQNQDQATKGSWNVPACFSVLTDLSDEEQTNYDATLSQPVNLSRSL